MPDETMVEDALREQAAPERRSQREKLAEISHEFAHVPVRVGTQQSAAMETIREGAMALAKQIAVLCPEGDSSTRIAIERVLEAKMWATQALSHRGDAS